MSTELHLQIRAWVQLLKERYDLKLIEADKLLVQCLDGVRVHEVMLDRADVLMGRDPESWG